MYLLFCTFQDVSDWLGASRDLPLYFVPVHQGQNGSIVRLPHENLQPHGEVMKPVEKVMIYMSFKFHSYHTCCKQIYAH